MEPEANVWAHPELRVAVATEDWPALLKTWRKLTRSSQSKLGALVGLAQPDVSAIENRRRVVTSVEVRQRIIRGLGIPLELLGARHKGFPLPSLVLPGVVSETDAERLTAVKQGGLRLDTASLDAMDALLAAHRRAEDTVGSRAVTPLVMAQFEEVAALYHQARGPLADRVVKLLAEYAQFLAWMAQDQDNAPVALGWFDRSYDWALESGYGDMAATTMSMKAHLAWSQGKGRRCVRLGEAAASTAGASETTKAMAVQMVGRGHALEGDADEAYRRLDEAEQIIANALDAPPWLYFYGEPWFTAQRGMADLHLREWSSAVENLLMGLTGFAPSFRRDRAWYGACLAHAYAGAGEAEAALETALSVITDASEIGRPHAWGELHKVAGVLMRRRAPEGRTLFDALATLD
ncbi:helix-turn-helix domain-containing protein [Streptomyces sudanensis]|uniref:helix-turn-helix domain-containing protein n=1 Tax=Streptomyces sudanensis TaxID=436397 RepID=UPI0020CB6D1C|nr:helix-turn-helix transcriptional regulator [Streptomyces sudanensis]MCP9957882.1 helix-turn-helix domain-containing protein [Streptomyces sudanensis]MCQ0001585.1 helix-turn-helix domain-containing protein [Streptomyces sudanensis]